MTSDYSKFLEKRHNEFHTPVELIDSAIHDATGEVPLAREKIIKGEVNEVYLVTLSSRQVVVRISHYDEHNFELEKWAIERCADKGVPVPSILALKNYTHNDSSVSICVQEKIDGVPANEVKFASKDAELEFIHKISIKAGSLLSKIHSVQTSGFGRITKKGAGKFSTFKELMYYQINKKDEFLRLAESISLEPHIITQTMDILTENDYLYESDISVLNHGDFGPKHIMIDGDKITGILDFGNIKAGHPILDFAWWEFFRGDWLPTTWLMEGYENKDLFTENFEIFLHTMSLYYGLIFLYFYNKEKNSDGLAHAKKRILVDLTYFQS